MIYQNDNNQINFKEGKINENLFINENDNSFHENNIEYLVNEIKEAEKKMKKELKEKQINKNIISSTSMPKIELTPINIQTIQYILSNKIRTQNMLIVLNAMLSNMKFLSNDIDIHDKEKLISSLSTFLKLEKKQKGSILFRYGNKGSRFFIVLGGEISVLILKEVYVELTFLNYIKYLLYLKIIKEDELAKKIIAANSISNFKLNEKYLDTYYENILSFINKYYLRTYVNENKGTKFISSKKVFENKYYFKNENKIDGIKPINNNLRLNTRIKSFKRQSTIDESRFNSVILNRSNILSIKEKEKGDEKLEESEKNKIEKNELKNNNKELNEINDNNLPKIKYKVKSKMPNYFELDIGSLGPYDLANLINYVILNLEKFTQKEIKVNSIDEYIKMCSIDENLKIIDKNKKKERLSIFEYFEITKKVEGDTFGELALQHEDNKRTATMIVTKDSSFCYISKSDFNFSLKGIEMKKRKRDINFIMSFSLFGDQSWIHFEKQYFNFFKKENLVSGQIIINQKEIIENIYFIMKGQIEISTQSSIHDIIEIVKQKNKRIRTHNLETNTYIKEENEKYLKNYDIYNENINENEKVNKKNKERKKHMFLNKKLIKEMKEIKNYRLCVVDNKDILGLNDICNEPKISFIKATCISSEAVIFSIKINIFEQLRKKNKKMKNNIQEIYEKRENLMIERLKSIINQTKMKVKQNEIKNLCSIKKNENKITNMNKRLITAFKTQNRERISSGFESTLLNYKDEIKKICSIKQYLNSNLNSLKKKSKNKIYLKNQNQTNDINNISFNEKKIYNDIKIKKEKKTGFEKFIESVTKRVNQINNHVNYSKFSRLFCPIYNKKNNLDSDKLKTENNIINITDANNKRNFSPLLIDKNYNQLLSNKSLYKNIMFKNPKESFPLSQSKNNPNLTETIISIENSEKNFKQFKKIYLTKESKIQKVKKNLIKLINPNIENSQSSRNYKIKTKKFKTLDIDRDKNFKPAKVDLLLYYKIYHEKESNYNTHADRATLNSDA